jgi:hypothetical protein
MYAFLVIAGRPKGPDLESMTAAHASTDSGPAPAARPAMTNVEMPYDCAPAAPAAPLAGSSCTDSPQPQAAV